MDYYRIGYQDDGLSILFVSWTISTHVFLFPNSLIGAYFKFITAFPTPPDCALQMFSQLKHNFVCVMKGL